MKAISAAAAVAVLLLTACSPHADERGTPARAALAAPNQAIVPGTALPPVARGKPRYVGRWATRTDLCTGGGWVFTRDHFGMEDGPECRFDRVAEAAGGYRIEARCSAHGEKEGRAALTIRFAESARAMLVDGLPGLPETGLIYCGKS